MNNQSVYAFVAVLLILTLFLVLSSFNQNKSFQELQPSGYQSFADCFQKRAQCLTVKLNANGSFGIKEHTFNAFELSKYIDSKFQNVKKVYLFLDSPEDFEHQMVVSATNELIGLQPRFSVSWVKRDDGI